MVKGIKKIRVAMLTTNLEMTGISSVIMNYISNLNPNKYELTVLAGEPVNDLYCKKCQRDNVRLITLPNKRRYTKEFYTSLFRYLKCGNYDIFHVHGSSATLAIDLIIAKIAGIKVRIAHSHNTTTENKKIDKILRPFFNLSYTNALACGSAAGKWLFGKRNFDVILNGFDVEKFKFSQSDRVNIRHTLNIDDDVEVIGHVGRFNYQKNHNFIIDIFEEYMLLQPKSLLLLIGTGPDFEKVKERISRSKCSKNILVYGETKTPSKFYMGMDKFIFPSRFEGLPVTLLEAQISGLPAVISDVITNEVRITPNICYASLKDSPKDWAEKLYSLPKQDREKFWSNNEEKFESLRIENSIRKLDDYYVQVVGNK